jgi:hypothetical protein
LQKLHPIGWARVERIIHDAPSGESRERE